MKVTLEKKKEIFENGMHAIALPRHFTCRKTQFRTRETFLMKAPYVQGER